MQRLSPLVAAALTAAALPAQHVAYPQDTVVSRRGTLLPLGTGASPGSAVEEARWQQLVPAELLPTDPGPIRGIAAVSGGILNAEETVLYRSLRITLSHASGSTLGAVFEDNLPVPVVVFDRASFDFTWLENRWGELRFDRPFRYDGHSGLVVEIRKEVDERTPRASVSMNVPGNPGRPDLPRAAAAFGPRGSGAAAATTAESFQDPIFMRLLVEGPILSLRSDPTNAPFGNVFALGETMALTVAAPSGTRYCAWFGSGFGPRVTLPGIAGAGVVTPGGELPVRTVSGSSDTVQVTIPSVPSLVGSLVTVQAGAAARSGAMTFTNGAGFIVNP